MEKEKTEVEMGRGQEFHFQHIGTFFRYPNGDVRWAVVYPSGI